MCFDEYLSLRDMILYSGYRLAEEKFSSLERYIIKNMIPCMDVYDNTNMAMDWYIDKEYLDIICSQLQQLIYRAIRLSIFFVYPR